MLLANSSLLMWRENLMTIITCKKNCTTFAIIFVTYDAWSRGGRVADRRLQASSHGVLD